MESLKVESQKVGKGWGAAGWNMGISLYFILTEGHMVSPQYDPDWVKEFYDNYGMKEWERWDRRPVTRVSWAVHVHYLRQFVKSAQRVLEMGAGAGRFTQVLADIGARVTVADISPGQLTINAQQAQELGFEHAVEGRVECDVCDLRDCFADSEFDVAVCYGGALSYLYGRADEALSELKRVTKPGGVILIEVMSLWGAYHSELRSVLDMPFSANREIIRSGDLTKELAVSTHYIHMYRASEFRELLVNSGLEIELITTTNALSTHWDEQLKDVPEGSDAWQHLIEMELEACREPGCLDLGEHLIGVCRNAG